MFNISNSAFNFLMNKLWYYKNFFIDCYIIVSFFVSIELFVRLIKKISERSKQQFSPKISEKEFEDNKIVLPKYILKNKLGKRLDEFLNYKFHYFSIFSVSIIVICFELYLLKFRNIRK
ncbi:MAG TPA: hypothetical protein VN854_00165 [Mycoplasmatales bacterium]|nr:hypothetical protein [Mycoplasmatales bacterium]